MLAKYETSTCLLLLHSDGLAEASNINGWEGLVDVQQATISFPTSCSTRFLLPPSASLPKLPVYLRFKNQHKPF